MEIQRQKVLELLKSIETKDQKPARYINPTKYVQHNLAVADGLEGFGEVMAQLAQYPEPAKVNTVRAFVDGDYVFTHTEYNFFGPKVGFDIFRFEDGQIVEHWDNICEMHSEKNPSGRSQTDGEREVRDTDKTEHNKLFVERFIGDVVIERRLDAMDSFFDGENFLQHSPNMEDGQAPLRALLESNAIHYRKIHKILGEGNFVLVVGEGVSADDPKAATSLYDLFRVDHGKIVEHWSTREVIPQQHTWRNQNGKFGFVK